MPKKILITQSQLRNYSGSEMVTLELAEYFSDSGWEVTVLAHHASDPIKADIEAASARLVLTGSPESDKLSAAYFDIVWVHHYTLTARLIKDLNSGHHEARIVFHHMSATEPLEFPMFPEFEVDVADSILYNSQETMQLLTQRVGRPLVESDKNFVFDNPAPDSFLQKTPPNKGSNQPRKIAIISNHPPAELTETSRILEAAGVEVDFIGRSKAGKSQRMTPDLLTSYEAVITIGKTVQYSILAGLPVYVYDRFGGPGYLSDDNYGLAHYHNFSGRGGFSKRSAEVIAEEILQGYKSAQRYIQVVRTKYSEDFRLSSKIDDLLTKPNSDSSPEARSVNEAVVAYVGVLQRLFPVYTQHIHHAKTGLVEQKRQIDKLRRSIENYQHQIEEKNKIIYDIRNSRLMKTAAVIRTPLHHLRRLIGRKD